MNNKLKKIETIFLNTILVLLIIITIIFAFCYIQMSRNNQKYINIFGYSIMQVKTGSMAKTINVKDIVIIKITKEVNKNDIVTYFDGNVLITHRIIEMSNKNIVTKGDANNSKDKPITKDQIIGKVVYIIPKIGVWQKVLTTPKVIISGSISICLLYFVCTSNDKRKDADV